MTTVEGLPTSPLTDELPSAERSRWYRQLLQSETFRVRGRQLCKLGQGAVVFTVGLSQTLTLTGLETTGEFIQRTAKATFGHKEVYPYPSNLAQETPAEAIETITETYALDQNDCGVYLRSPDARDGLASMWDVVQLLNMLDTAKQLGLNTEPLLQKLLDATNTLYQHNSVDSFSDGYDATAHILFGKADRYVDDNLWMAQLQMRLYHETGDKTYAERANGIIQLFLSQQRLSSDGGAYWEVQTPAVLKHYEAAVSNATAVPVLTDLYEAGFGGEEYLVAAKQAFQWLQKLHDPVTGLYFDKIQSDGTIDTSIYTYVQAEALAAMMSLNKVDPATFPLDRAIAFAYRAMDYFAAHETYGNPRFDTILARVLGQLASIVNDPTLTAAVQQANQKMKDALPKIVQTSGDAAALTTLMMLTGNDPNQNSATKVYTLYTF